MQITGMMILDRSIALRVLGVVLLAAALGARADVTFGTSQIKVGAHPLKVEVAASDPQRTQGLMYRKSLGKNDGMLFVFDQIEYHSMWMKNTLIPLSVAYIADDGAIVNIEDMKPQTEDSHCAKKPVRFALEMNLGWFASKALRPGTKLRGLEKYKPQ